ncbi:MAG TPA: rRNA pseudouridine synthase [Acidimicrobiales bacterium]|nr:rRNA pseudouridine synthase [Acidimicrobiales bacterium]
MGRSRDRVGEQFLLSRPDAQGERLQKVLARAGVASRRAVEDMIRQGRIRVDGEPAHLGQRVDISDARITVDGVPVPVAPGLVYRLLNKPSGVVTTADDPQGRAKVIDLVPGEPRVVPVGRLDMDTEGLLLLTNDGELVHRLTHPSFGVDKEYLAQVEGNPRPAALRTLRQGVRLDDGLTAPARASSPGEGLVRLVIHEGRNRQVRRMCAAVGHPVTRLVRTRIGPLVDPRLKPGEWRDLTPAEVAALYAATASSPAGAPLSAPGESTGGTDPGVGYDALP